MRSRFVDGLRYTDEETMDVVQSVLCGKVNKNLVAQLNRLGGQAIGLCGMDGAVCSRPERLDEKYGLVGDITGVNPEPVENALHQRATSQWCPPWPRAVDADTAYNINADTAAAKLAEALACGKADFADRRPGPAAGSQGRGDADPCGPTPMRCPAWWPTGIISGGMIPKMECCVDAIAGGVERVHILDGRHPPFHSRSSCSVDEWHRHHAEKGGYETMTSRRDQGPDRSIHYAYLRPFPGGHRPRARARRLYDPEGRAYIDFTSGIGVY